MKLIAKKPCRFGGQKFYIGDEIPESLVADVKLQEKYGVITIIHDGRKASGGQFDALFTQEQVEAMIAEAVEEAEKKRTDQLTGLQEQVAELEKIELGAYEGTIPIAVKGASDGHDMTISVKPEEIQQVFSIMQRNVEEGVRAVAEVESENVLILLHVADSRKMVKNAANEQVEKLFSTREVPNESSKNKERIATNTEGVDT